MNSLKVLFHKNMLLLMMWFIFYYNDYVITLFDPYRKYVGEPVAGCRMAHAAGTFPGNECRPRYIVK